MAGTELQVQEDVDVVKEAEWEHFIRSLHIWEMRRLCKNELAWHDRYVAGKLDLLEVYREIAEPKDYDKAVAEPKPETPTT